MSCGWLQCCGKCSDLEDCARGALRWRVARHFNALIKRRCSVEDLKGGDASLNAQILRDVFGGQQGAVADALCLNAGVALAAAQVAANAQDGVKMAQVGHLLIIRSLESALPLVLPCCVGAVQQCSNTVLLVVRACELHLAGQVNHFFGVVSKGDGI